MENKVYLAGVFDVLHRGHLSLIQKASKLGKLTVGVVKDHAVKAHKGEGRPIMDEQYRKDLVYNLKGVSYTEWVDGFYFSESVINGYDFICVGEDQKHFNIEDIPIEKLIILPRTPNVSTTDIVKKLKE